MNDIKKFVKTIRSTLLTWQIKKIIKKTGKSDMLFNEYFKLLEDTKHDSIENILSMSNTSDDFYESIRDRLESVSDGGYTFFDTDLYDVIISKKGFIEILQNMYIDSEKNKYIIKSLEDSISNVNNSLDTSNRNISIKNDQIEALKKEQRVLANNIVSMEDREYYYIMTILVLFVAAVGLAFV